MIIASRSSRRLLAPALLLLAGCGYNTIQSLDEQTNSARSQIEVQLQRRADLIPNLVQTVKGYATHEETVFKEVADARARLAGSIQTHDPSQMASADAQMTGALGRLLAISEAYPQLKANENFIRLQDELTGTENRIAVSRKDYNDAARQYNTYIRTFPQALTAKATGAKSKSYFEVANAGVRETPTVDFSRPAAPAAPATPPATTPPSKP
ncbi:MAG: LemA family protein [Gemmatimonadaceae bacterium]